MIPLLNVPESTRPEGWEIWYDDAYEVSAEVVRGFARAVRDPHVPYGARGILPADTPVPATLLAAPMFDAASALVSRSIPQCNLSRIVHAAQQFTVRRPLRIGQRLSFGARLASHVVKASTDIIVIDVTAYADGDPHVEAVITIAHSASAGPEVDLDAVADRIMLAGTGPSDSDAYTAGAEPV
ncbi:Uncharacterised protein (plasmid) [Tsukamurella tyrosinosolvens]|uniref:N-terminal half of MaoC dehydratase n=1 Tax=Tsukamurella tyrosinosolvens TaxID=57704 RepID=A0A1H4KUQ8_TSUTY|nr:MaoC family dehydratase N-terminal domain-containing protein [Tsukamurella tyrosinosolvens]KXO96407.1 hypothetical protein AXK58_03670 [Tsukamurella tyrosinosolvens]KXP01228.1 hypothetical protein AXK59_23335 [Tsukamurella tyrosinosolvens]KZL94549.1 hypothetical protein AXX05_08900 [Tsukamurella tyrosinosolvens]SEB62260.1 N-terminal half of MaoC dehydratase [Tsukamurella tyrosinosolvens]VEH94738.1 Uncharacterised protein [Tsukamurella tyrosinosolvens]